MANVSSSNSQGVRVPKLRFPGFEGEWEKSAFSDTFSFLGNNTLSRAELSNEGEIKNIHYGDVLIKFGDVISADDKMIPCVKDANSLKKTVDYLQTGDIVFADTAEDDSVGKATEILNPNNTAVVSGLHTIPCRPNYAFVPSYLGYYMNSKAFHDQLYPFMQGIKVTSISKGNIGKALISYPHLSEQKKIADLLMLLSKRIEKQRQLVEALKSYKRGALSKLFPKNGENTPEYRFAGFTGAWERRKLKEVADFSKGQGYTKSDLKESGTPIILYGRLYTKYQPIIREVDTFADVIDGAVLSKGIEVILPSSGETAEDIAIAASVEKSGFLLGGGLNIVVPHKELQSAFLAIEISTGEPHNDLARRAQGKSIVHLYNEDLKEITISFPTREEQIKISMHFDAIDTLITLHQRKLEEYQIVKSGLLQQLFI